MKHRKTKAADPIRLNVTTNAAAVSPTDPYLVTFNSPQVITNGTVQKDGTYYDIPSLDVESYNGKVYGNHEYGYEDVLGTVVGLKKDVNAANGGDVTITGIRFAKNHPDAELARDLLAQNLVELSTGTIGFTEDDGRRANHRMIDLSIVGMGNNDFTTTNMKEVAAVNGFDLSNYDLKETNSMGKVKNTQNFPVTVTYKDANGAEVKATLAPGDELEVSQDQVQAVQKQIDDAKAPAPAHTPAPAAPVAGNEPNEPAAAPAGNKAEAGKQPVSRADFEKVQNSLDTLLKNMNIPAKPAAGGTPEEGGMAAAAGVAVNALTEKIKGMKAGERLHRQIELERSGNKSSDEYRAINEFNAEELVAKNYMDDSAGSVAGLIPPYELLDKIVGCETNYDDLLSKFGYDEMGLTYGWNQRIGDVAFTPLGYCDPSTESDFETELQTRTQERLATHTVICDKVTRFSPTNVVNMVSKRYQVAYKKALAAFLIAELQVAVDLRVAGLVRAGTDIPADPNGTLTYPGSGQTAQLLKITQLFTDLYDCADNGLLIMNAATAAKLITDLGITATGASGNNGLVTVRNYDRLAAALGAPVLVVPKDLMPTLGSGATVTVPRTANAGGNVTVNKAIFYIEPQNWQGVTNGTMQLDIDSFSPYEVTVTKTDSGSDTVTVVETRSAKQRGETVLFGEMYRGGGVLDWRNVGGVAA